MLAKSNNQPVYLIFCFFCDKVALFCPCRSTDRTAAFEAAYVGSIPAGGTNKTDSPVWVFLFWLLLESNAGASRATQAGEGDREAVASPNKRKRMRDEADSCRRHIKYDTPNGVSYFIFFARINGKGRKREFTLAEESSWKPEGFHENKRSERVRFRRISNNLKIIYLCITFLLPISLFPK